MRFTFDEDQLLFQSTVRSLLEKESTPADVRAAWASEVGLSKDLWRKLGDVGVLGLLAPEDQGGLGMDEVGLVLLLEELGRAAVSGPIVETAAVAAPLLRELAAGGFPQLAAEWLPQIAGGRAVVTVGFGAWPFVADALAADLLLLERDGEIHALAPGWVKLIPQSGIDGGRRLSSVGWSPRAETLVAAGPVAVAAAEAGFDRLVLGTAAQLLGVGQQMLDMAVEYAKEREQFGVPIGSFQAVKHKLADVVVQIEFARPVVHRAAFSVATGLGTRARDVSMAKAYASDAALGAARAALQVHGAIGYTWEHDLHLWMKRAWSLASAWGDAAWHRRRVADAVVGAW